MFHIQLTHRSCIIQMKFYFTANTSLLRHNHAVILLREEIFYLFKDYEKHIRALYRQTEVYFNAQAPAFMQ
jgi:hypothetical protein